MNTLRITDIGAAGGLVLPPEVAEELGAKQGDELRVVATKAGVELQRQDVSVSSDEDLIRQIMAEDDQVLRKLAE